MITLNQVLKSIKSFFEQHAQVNSVVVSSDLNFASLRDLTYPAVQINYRSTELNERLMTYKFRVKIADLVDSSVEGMEYEIYSDANLIAEDFFTWLWQQRGFMVTKRTDLSWFNLAGGEISAGITFDVALSVVRSQNDCATPTK